MCLRGHTERLQHHQLRPIWSSIHYEYVRDLDYGKLADFVLADDGARGIVEMLFCTSLIALVGAADQPQSSPRKLQIVNTKVSNNWLSETRSYSGQEPPFVD